MEAEHRKLLQRHRMTLAKDLCIDEICQILFAEDILSDHMVEVISSKKSTFEKNVAFLTKLPTRGPLAFSFFIQALHETGQGHLAQILCPSLQSTRLNNNIGNMNEFPSATDMQPSSFSFAESTPTKGSPHQIFDSSFEISSISNTTPKSCKIVPSPRPVLTECSPNTVGQSRSPGIPVTQNQLTPVEHMDISVISNDTSPSFSAKRKFVPHNHSNLDSLRSNSSIENLRSTAGLTRNNHNLSPANNNHISCTISQPNHTLQHQIIPLQPVVSDAPAWDNVKVRPTSLEFLRSRMNDSYPLFKLCKGITLLISVTEFEPVACLDDRLGGERDCARLELMFQQLSYENYQLKNGTAAEIWNTLKNFSSWAKLAEFESCFIVLMSHGQDGIIFGRDGKAVSLPDVYDLFSNEKCPHLQNKPKVFLVQACRGDQPDKGTDQLDGPANKKGQSHGKSAKRKLLDTNNNNIKSKLPTMSDCLVAYATVPGYAAMRNTEQGSWFIQAFIQIVAHHAKDKSLLEIMTMTNNHVMSREGWSPDSDFHRCKEMSEFTSCLCKPLYFFPGIYLKQMS
ncbi:caspase-2-like [Styela clava]